MASSHAIPPDHLAALTAAASRFPSATAKPFTYGTAGFRMSASLLPSVAYAVGLLAQLRSRKHNGAAIGVMITASHNPAQDNGVKIVDPMGDMLEQSWEAYATRLANAQDAHELAEAYLACVEELKVDLGKKARVIYARDTRPSGKTLAAALAAALEATGTESEDYGWLTTPQLHYLVRAQNTKGTDREYGEVSEEGYYKKLAAAWERCMQHVSAKTPLTVDCANGVGAPKLKELVKFLPPDKLRIHITHDAIENPALLNSKAGADWVKTQQRVPASFTGSPGDRWCSFDGDADRIVYYFTEPGDRFRLLDGDRIATLSAQFIGDLVKKAGLEDQIKIGVVQTAYANGASTKYIEQTLKLKVEFTNTGVKHLHHAASRMDIGVYFEANGHGTVLFSERALKAMRKHDPQSPAQLEAFETLKAVHDLINQTVGDALSDMLLVEVILAHKEWTVHEWLATYTDLPNKLAKVLVKDRSEFKVVEGTAERKLETPERIQPRIDEVVAKFREGRCFVRPSGTEDAVRVYGEAAEAYDVETMVGQICEFISSGDVGAGKEGEAAGGK